MIKPTVTSAPRRRPAAAHEVARYNDPFAPTIPAADRHISLVGWLVSSAGSAPMHRVVSALAAVVVITASGFIVHRRVERLIDTLEDL